MKRISAPEKSRKPTTAAKYAAVTVMATALFLIIASFLLFGVKMIGFTTGHVDTQTAYTVSESGSLTWHIDSHPDFFYLTSIDVTGYAEGSGSMTVYIVNSRGERYMLLNGDSVKVSQSGNSITGYAADGQSDEVSEPTVGVSEAPSDGIDIEPVVEIPSDSEPPPEIVNESADAQNAAEPEENESIANETIILPENETPENATAPELLPEPPDEEISELPAEPSAEPEIPR
jgi:hypothetical protein